jgi:hypothetical protein
MRLSCVLLVEFRAQARSTSVDETARTLFSETHFYATYEEAQKGFIDMIDRGNSYKNLEKYLGNGVCLVLGMDLSESQ